MFELRQRYRDRTDLQLLAITYWESIDAATWVREHGQVTLHQTRMGHACEWETSMIMALRPDLVVGDPQQVREIPEATGAAPGYRGWIMSDRSQPGHIGNPAAATVSKGELLFQAFTYGVSTFLARVATSSTNSRWDI